MKPIEDNQGKRGTMMSHSASLKAYPAWMLEVAGRFEAPTLSMREVMHFSSPQEASRYRQQFYGLRNAIEREAKMDYPNFLSIHILLRGNDVHLLHADEFLPRPDGV